MTGKHIRTDPASDPSSGGWPSGHPSEGSGGGQERSDASFDVLPRDALPCVWMSAGLVAYKLCDHDYDCDSCPLDAVLGGARAVRRETTMANRARSEIRPDRRYHASHGWVLPLEAGCVRCGVDAIAARLLDQTSRVVLPSPFSHIQRGQPAYWLLDESELIPFRAPVSGTVVRTNPAVQADATLIVRSPYDLGWLFEVRCDEAADKEEELVSAEELRHRSALELRKLHQERTKYLRGQAGVGPTMADGGKPLFELRKILGTRRYHALVRRFLG